MGKNKIMFISILISFLYYLIVPNLIIKNIGYNEYMYLFKPLAYVSFAIISTIFILSDTKTFNTKKEQIIQFAAIGSLLYIIIYFLVGLLIGYSTSPFSHKITGLLSNLFTFMIVAVTEEIIRASYIKSDQESKHFVNIILITIVFTIMDIERNNYTNAFGSLTLVFAFLLKDFFPSLISNLFLSYLIYRGGIGSALIYKIPFLFFYLISPILPATNYVLMCIIKAIVPLIIYFKIEKEYFEQVKYSVQQSFLGFEKVKLIIFVIILSIIVSFTTGVFSVSPVVVLTGSMEPVIKRGDVVIFQKTDYNNIEINDVIVYNLDNIKVIHRVVKIEYDENNNKILITKGDNNNSVDPKDVNQSQVKGKVKLIIPKIGYPTIWINETIKGVKNNIGVETGD